PWVKLQRARAAAKKLGADTVIVHPPVRWQQQYARDFVTGIWRMAEETDVRFAVENMYPWRYRDREMLAYAPDREVTVVLLRHVPVGG
ncbi:sugar phosphate isomerase/epimerase, partial [Xylella fastidiosa subsp. multiplex]|nr:sugar phosphate isomerase/epimerase [Xylella fastidiosa subsp. multiplex]